MPTPDEPLNEEEIFQNAAALPVPERAPYLRSACDGNPEVRAAVERLLASVDDSSFMQKPMERTTSPEMEAEFARLKPEEAGEVIGNYKLLQQIGEGGFGVVWMAEQEKPVRRRVALKIIKLGMHTKEVIARFEQERQALAIMDHPNIAKVLDAGATPFGRPFFAMELVRGVKITEYCDKANLSTSDRLRLFIAVCHAVQHAHQKGIIHRDLKPSNILVTLHDGVPVPKVIDFGVAKATQQQRLTDLTLFTHFEQMVGTPLYMSPEQAELSGLDIDTRSDIYSLGVLLYELLTGRTPFDPEALIRAGLDEIRRVIREVEPQKPSTFVSTMAVDLRTNVAQHRQSDSGKLIGLIRGDLDWIAMKALEKDRNRRYETATGLAKDIERHLSSEPVLARPPSQLYRFRRFAKRNKVKFAAAVIVSIALIVGLTFSTFSFLREQTQRREADRQRQIAKTNAEQAAHNAAQALQKESYARRLLYASDMNLAQQAIEQNNLKRARALLDRHRPQQGIEDLRGWEWRLLWQQCRGDDFHFVTKRDGERACSVSFSADGRRLAVGYYGGRVEIWDVGNRTLTKVLNEGRQVGPGSPVARVAFSPVADAAAFSVEGVQVRWHDFSQNEERLLCTAPGQIRDIAFSYDGAQFVVLTRNREAALIINSASGQLDKTIELPPGGHNHFNNARISPDHQRLYVTVGALTKEPKLRCIRLLDTEVIWEKGAFDAVEKAVTGFSAMDISPDGKVLATARGYQTKTIQLWDAESGEPLGVLQGHNGWVWQVKFSLDGTALASASIDQTLRLWNTTQWQEAIAPFRGHAEEVLSVSIAPNGQTVAAGARDGAILLWDTRDRKPTGGGKMLPPNVDSARILPGGKTALVTSAPSDFSLLDLTTAREPKTISHGKPGAFIPPNFLGVLDQPNLLKLYALSDSGSKLIAQLAITPFPRRTFAYCAKKRLFAWTEDGKTIHLTNVDRPQDRVDIASEEDMTEPVRFAPDGRYLLAANGKGIARVWDLTSLRRVPKAEQYFSPADCPLRSRFWRAVGWGNDALDGWMANATALGTRMPRPLDKSDAGPQFTGEITDRAFSPDGHTYAISDVQGKVGLYKAGSLERLATLHGRSTSAFSVAFSPDGTRLAAGGDVLWDVATRQELLTLPSRDITPRLAEFSDDGSTLLVVLPGDKGSFQFWRAPSWQEIEEAEHAGKGWSYNEP